MQATGVNGICPGDWLTKLPENLHKANAAERMAFLYGLREVLGINKVIDAKNLAKRLKDNAKTAACAAVAPCLRFLLNFTISFRPPTISSMPSKQPPLGASLKH